MQTAQPNSIVYKNTQNDSKLRINREVKHNHILKEVEPIELITKRNNCTNFNNSE